MQYIITIEITYVRVGQVPAKCCKLHGFFDFFEPINAAFKSSTGPYSNLPLSQKSAPAVVIVLFTVSRICGAD